jgi:opacity protein-like surface antigen
MKKILCLLGIACALARAASAFELPPFSLSAGGGLVQAFEPGGGGEWDVSGKTYDLKTSWMAGGAFGLFDAVYAEISLGFIAGSLTTQYDRSAFQNLRDEDSGFIMALSAGILGKFPFAVSDTVTVFPLAGIEFLPVLSAKDSKWDDILDPVTSTASRRGNVSAGDLSSLDVRFGGGVDFHISGGLFLRGEILYGVRLATKFEDDVKDYMGRWAAGAGARTGHGGSIRLAALWRFRSF